MAREQLNPINPRAARGSGVWVSHGAFAALAVARTGGARLPA